MGILGEPRVKGSLMGELGIKMIGEAFRNIRDGDSFWYELELPSEVVKEIQEMNFSSLLNSSEKNIFIIGN